MHRTQLLNLLENYKNKSSSDNSVADKFINFVKNNSDCFKRTLQYGHITGSAWVINEERTQTLLTHHKKLDKWLQLGGHVDGNSDVLAEAIREVEEESGLTKLTLISDGIFDLDVHLIPAHKNEPEHYHYDVRFCFSTNDPDNIVISDESHDLKWISIDEIEKFTREQSVLRMVDKCFSL
ncbi:MAG: NUDIX hydrolase [Melioribacteraceae bacterium]